MTKKKKTALERIILIKEGLLAGQPIHVQVNGTSATLKRTNEGELCPTYAGLRDALIVSINNDLMLAQGEDA